MKMDKYTQKVKENIEIASENALSDNRELVEAEDLMLSIISDEDNSGYIILKKIDANIDNIREALHSYLGQLPRLSTAKNPYISESLSELLRTAEKVATKWNDGYVSAEHLLLAVFEYRNHIRKIFDENNVSRDKIESALKDIRGNRRVVDNNPESKYNVISKFTSNVTERARDGKLDPVIGRDSEIRRIMEVLSRRTKNNPVLIGDPGVGKTAIVEGLAQRIISEDVPETLKNKQVLAIDIGSLIAGTKFRGEFEERFKALLNEIVENRDKYILFIDELHTIVGAGRAEGAIDASNMLKPALARGDLHCIGATTTVEYTKYIEKDKALERRFQPVIVNEPSIDETISILRGLKSKYELHHGVKIHDSAIVAAVNLSTRYISERYLPDKAIDVIDEAASRVRVDIDSMPNSVYEVERKLLQLEIEKEGLKKETDTFSKERLKAIEYEFKELKEKESSLKGRWLKEKEIITNIRKAKEEIDRLHNEEAKAEREGDLERVAIIRYGNIRELKEQIKKEEEKLRSIQKDNPMLREEVGEEEVAEVISHWTNIPVSRLIETESEKLLHLEDKLHERVADQNNAIKLITSAVKRVRVGLADPRKPVGTFIFLGPTGVGKTEVAKALAESLFGDEKMVIRIDMSEYMEKYSVSRLIGAPPGYVGYEEGGVLTESVRHHPYSVILFDEIEKAHRDVFNILLQVLDDGRLTDGQGRIVNFKNTIIIMTSNIGTETAVEGEININDAMNGLRNTFRPEFINRIDEIVIFNPLSREDMERIVDIQMNQIRKIMKNRHMDMELSKEVKQYFAEIGYEPQYGARPLKRIMQKELIDKISTGILEGKYREGDMINVTLENNQLTFTTDDKRNKSIVRKSE